MTILTEIENYLREKDMRAWLFGKEVMGDSHLVEDIRKGRRVSRWVEDRIRSYIRDGYVEARQIAPRRVADMSPIPVADEVRCFRKMATRGSRMLLVAMERYYRSRLSTQSRDTSAAT